MTPPRSRCDAFVRREPPAAWDRHRGEIPRADALLHRFDGRHYRQASIGSGKADRGIDPQDARAYPRRRADTHRVWASNETGRGMPPPH